MAQYKTFNKRRILSGPYTSQKQRAEAKTQRAIEHCHDRLTQAVQACFLKKRAQLARHPQQLNSLPLDPDQMQGLTAALEDILAGELFSRFGFHPRSVISVEPLLDQDISDALNLVKEWRAGETQSLLLAQHLERWGQIAWNEALNKTPLQPLDLALESINLPEQFLHFLGINSQQKLHDLQEGSYRRLSGILDHLEHRFINQLKKYTSRLFYTLHDLTLAEKYTAKISIKHA